MVASNKLIGEFANFDDRLSSEIRTYGELIKFDKYSTIFDADNTLNWFYIIVSGKVKVYDINFKTNREQTVYMLTKGDMFDVVTLLDNKLHELAIDILEAGEVIKFPINKVREWMHLSITFEQLIYKYVAMQMRNLEELALDLSLLETKERLLKLILKNIESIDKKGVDILSKLSHKEIANLIGTVRHVIDRHLRSLEKDGVIDIEKRKISLKNAKKVLDMLTSL